MKFKVLILFSLVNLIGFSQSLEESIQSISNLPDSVQADSMTRLARLSLIDENPILGLKQVKWALELANRKKIKNIIPFARFYTARIFSNINQYDSSLVHYKKALIEIENTKYDKWEIYIVKGIGNIYRQKGDFKNAIAIQLNALKGFEEKGDSLNLAELYTEIGYSYDRMKDFNTALIYHRKAIDYLQEKDPYFKNFIVGRIAIAYDDLGDYDSAHYYNFRALSFEVKNGDSAGVGMTCSNIGNTFIKQRNWPKAEAFLKRANRLNLIHGDNGNKAISHINLGNVQIELEQFNKASSTLNKGIQYSKSWLNSKFLSEAYKLKSNLFEKTNNFDSSLFYYKAYKTIEDSLYALDKLNQIEEISTKYETEKKEQQIKLQKVSLENKESELKANQRTIIALIIFALLVLVLAFTAYKRYQAKKNVEVQSRIIEEQEKGLQAVFTAQEEERKRISKDLHDGIGQQLSGLKMAIQTTGTRLIKKVPEEEIEFKKLAKIASDSADEVRSISHQMMPRALTELGLIEAIADMLDKSLGLSNINYEFEHFGIENRLPEKVEISLYRVSQELINNIIKHSSAKKVSVQLFKNQDKVILVVEDDGTGIKPSNTNGHGLLNMRSRINTLKGEMNLEPSPNSGTLATVRIPL